MKPDRVIWPDTKERPKTLYLLEGLRRMGIEIVKSKHWIKKLRPRSNARGPYVYPIEFHYGTKKPLILYDINTIPRMFFSNLMAPGRFYFKTHLHLKDRHKFSRLFVAPNSPSDPALYLKHLEPLRIIRDRKKYDYDFLFLGWHDDNGLRMRCVKTALAQKWDSYAGLMPFKHHTTVPEKLKMGRLPYINHLTFQAKTRLNLALPGGRQLPYCSFRHIELWGIGAAVLTVKPDAVLPGDPDGCWIEFKRDMSDFVDVVNYYIRHDDEREAVAQKGRTYFDEYLAPEANAGYICRIIHERITR